MYRIAVLAEQEAERQRYAEQITRFCEAKGCISTAGERAHPGLLLPENGRTSLFRGAGTDGAVSAGDRGIFAAVRRSDRGRLSERKNPLTSAFLAMPPRVPCAASSR